MADPEKARRQIAELVDRARAAQKEIEYAAQEEVDDLVTRIAWALVRPKFAQALAEKLVEEAALGYAPDKYAKIQTKVRGALRDMKGKKTVGIVEVDDERGIMKIAKPMGVVGALMPVTNGEATPLLKAMFAMKTRNAIIMAPHPRAKETNRIAANQMRAVLKRQGYPEDLIIPVEEVSMEASKELLAQTDVVLATGGAGMVRAAYSSGTPSQGVGAGNAVCIVDETADLADAADKIMRSKTFDYATSCSAENSIVINESVYDEMLKELQAVGGYLLTPTEKKKLQLALWDVKTGGLNREIVARPAFRIAEAAGIDLPEGKSFLLVEETGVGSDSPFSGEKLSVTAAVYKWKEFAEAVELVNRITAYSGAGHSCGLHSTDPERIRELGLSAKVSRIMVRQPQCLANSGAWTNGMPMSLTLGCGSWGRNSTSSNVTWEHLLNYTWISTPIASTKPTDIELFGSIMDEE